MAKYEFTGGYARYYLSGLFAKPGEVHELPSAPDADWKPAEASLAPATPVPVPVATDDAQDAVRAVDALMAANPELAQKLVKEAAENA